MSDLSLIILSLQSKVKKLILLHQKNQEENEKLFKEREILLKLIEEHKNTIIKLEENNKVIKLAKTLSETKENKVEVKLKINELVREIDKCIALLNR